jgi:hypothetical protein
MTSVRRRCTPKLSGCSVSTERAPVDRTRTGYAVRNLLAFARILKILKKLLVHFLLFREVALTL